MTRGIHLEIKSLPERWVDTRATLQAIAQAVTAIPRAAAAGDPRWSHVAMQPTERGFAAAEVTLADGSTLTSEIDLAQHRVVVAIGETSSVTHLREGVSSRAIGELALALADDNGSTIEVDDDRLGTDAPLPYVAEDAEAFLEAAQHAIVAMERVNQGLSGDIGGPHLWPHGFDIATEWYSERVVTGDSGPANAQIAMGWYPAVESYFYVNPWPFRDEYAAIQLPVGASWHIEGWFGAKLDIPIGGSVTIYDAAALGSAVHEATRETLGT